eukprot:598312_1
MPKKRRGEFKAVDHFSDNLFKCWYTCDPLVKFVQYHCFVSAVFCQPAGIKLDDIAAVVSGCSMRVRCMYLFFLALVRVLRLDPLYEAERTISEREEKEEEVFLRFWYGVVKETVANEVVTPQKKKKDTENEGNSAENALKVKDKTEKSTNSDKKHESTELSSSDGTETPRSLDLFDDKTEGKFNFKDHPGNNMDPDKDPVEDF